MSIAHFACYDVLNFYCDSVIILLAQVCARVFMCVRRLIIKLLEIFKTFPVNIITLHFHLMCVKSADLVSSLLTVKWHCLKSLEPQEIACMRGIHDCLLYT